MLIGRSQKVTNMQKMKKYSSDTLDISNDKMQCLILKNIKP